MEVGNLLNNEEFDIPEEELAGLPVRLYYHIFRGRVSMNNNIYGVHHLDALTTKTENFDVGDIKIVPDKKMQKDNGFYEAQIACWNGQSWISKKDNRRNGFFPDSWSRQKVMEEISEAHEQIEVADWLAPIPPYRKSNAFVKQLPSGQEAIFFISSPKKNKPSRLGNYIVTVFPYFK